MSLFISAAECGANELASAASVSIENEMNPYSSLTLGTEETKAILDLLTIDFVLEKIEGLIPEDYQSIVAPILEKLPEILDSTTTLELSLHLQK